jgi:DNA polymerase III delta prime subunit
MLWVSHRKIVKQQPIEKLFPEFVIKNLLESNIVIFGPEGSGKRCFLDKYLTNRFKCGIWTSVLHDCVNSIDRKGTLEIMTRKSQYHVELRALDFGNNNKYLVKSIIKGFCEQLVLDENGNLTMFTIVLYGADHLTDEVLSILNVYIIRYTQIRFIFVMETIRSVLSNKVSSIRFPRPSLTYVNSYIRLLCEDSKQIIEEDDIERIYHKYSGNMTKCILELDIFLLGIRNKYELLIQEIVDEIILEEPNLKQMRTIYYQLLVNNVETKQIIKDVLKLVMFKCKDKPIHVLSSLVHSASVYEHHSCVGERGIYHLDAFGCSLIVTLQR